MTHRSHISATLACPGRDLERAGKLWTRLMAQSELSDPLVDYPWLHPTLHPQCSSHCPLAGRTTTDDELEEMLESGKPSIFISDVSATALHQHT